jgi:hypothetical protein
VSGQVLAIAALENKLYRLRVQSSTREGELALQVGGEPDSSTLWHERLGHPGSNAMEQFLRSGAKGVPPRVEAPKGVCSGCMKGKQARRKSSKQAKQASNGPLDLCGPMQVSIVGAGHNTLLLVDDSTRFKHFFVLQAI